MAKQTLSIEQMQHLQELGLGLKGTMLYWVVYEVGHENNFVTTKENAMEVIDESCGMLPAYTLQDVLDALPLQIKTPLYPKGGKYELRIKRMVLDEGRVMYSVVYEKEDYIDWIVLYSDKVLIDAAYSLLCWAIENGYVETKKPNEL